MWVLVCVKTGLEKKEEKFLPSCMCVCVNENRDSLAPLGATSPTLLLRPDR